MTQSPDLRGVTPDAAVDWDGKAVAPGAAPAPRCGLAGLDAAAGLTEAPAVGTAVPCKAALTPRRTQAFWLAPNACDTRMQAASPWPRPSFNGATLPLRHRAGPDGFDAQWALAGRPGSPAWQPAAACNKDAVPTYQMVGRAARSGRCSW